MSGLAALLAGHTPPGLYRWHSAFDVEDVRHAVEHAGWSFAHVDGWTGPTKRELLVALGEALELPGYYGANFDALEECLRSVAKDTPTVLLWDGWGPLAYDDPRAFRTAAAVLGDRAVDVERGRFAVLLRGEGPDVEAPDLDQA